MRCFSHCEERGDAVIQKEMTGLIRTARNDFLNKLRSVDTPANFLGYPNSGNPDIMTKGLSERQIEKFAFGNVLRLLHETRWPSVPDRGGFKPSCSKQRRKI